MSDAALAMRSPLQGLALPAGPRFALTEAPPAARFILRGGEGARVACGIAFGAEPPSRLGPAGEGGRRAALWLGPDEWLMIADGADADKTPTSVSVSKRLVTGSDTLKVHLAPGGGWAAILTPAP